MAEILPTIQEPNVSVDQTILNEGASKSVDAPQPGVVIGVKNVLISDLALTGKYTGVLHNFPLPNFEPGFKVYENSTLVPVLKNVIVSVLGFASAETGTISVNGDHTYLNTPDSGKFQGVFRGDQVTVIKSITSGVAGSVSIASPTVLTETNAMSGVIPGDIVTINNVDYNVLLVSVNSVTVDNSIGAGTSITWSINRKASTDVLSIGVTNNTASQIELNSDIGVGNVTFSITRSLSLTGAADGNQPLVTDVTLASGNFSLVDGVSTKDTLSVVANLAVDGFSNFSEVLNTGSATISSNVITIAGDLVSGTARLATGDVIYFNDDSANKYARSVVSVVASGANTAVTFDGSAILAAMTVKPILSIYKVLTSPVGGVGYNYDNAKSLAVSSAAVRITYKARATAAANTVIKIARVTDLDQLGANIPENHLRVAAQIMKANAGDNAVYAIISEDESLASYAKAYETAEGSLLYSIVPLTQSFSNVSAIKSHVDSMSTPSRCKWRVAFVNLKMPVEDYVVITTKSGVMNAVGVTSSGSAGTVYLTDTKANFSDVRIGQFLKVKQQDGVISTITGPDAASQSFLDGTGATKYLRVYKVLDIINSTKIKLEVLPYSGSAGAYVANSTTIPEANSSYVVTYEVVKVLNKDEQAQSIGHTGQSFSDRRFNYIPNETCIVEFTKPDGTVYDAEMPGYMYCAAVAGLVTITFPHQPLTRVPLAGIKGVRGGKEMFNSNQLSVMATGGCWMIVQDEVDVSAPYTWRQITTSQGGLKEQEFSFTKNLDEICYALFFDHQRFPGRNNRVARTLAAIEAQTRATLESRKTLERNSITGGFLGTQIIDYKLGGVIDDPLLLDTVYSDITLELPLPLNSIKFRVAA